VKTGGAFEWQVNLCAGYLLHQVGERESSLLRKGAWSRRKSDTREQVKVLTKPPNS